LQGNLWTLDLDNLEVEDQEGWVRDKPYLVQIGYRVTVGKECSVQTEIINGPFYGASKQSQDVDYSLPNGVGMMQYPGIVVPPNNLAAIVNHINNNGVTVYGSIIVAMRDGLALTSDQQRQFFESARVDVHNLLEETLAQEGIFTGNVNLTNFQLRIKQTIQTFFNTVGKITGSVVNVIFGVKENIVGVHLIALVDIPSSTVNPILDLLKAPINQYVNNLFDDDYIYRLNLGNDDLFISPSITINLSPIANIGNFNNFKIGQIDIDGTIITPGALADGKFSVSATIGGSGNYSFYQNSLGPLEFRLEKEWNTNTKAIYKAKGNFNKNTHYTIDGNHVNPTKCIIPESCQPNKILSNFGIDQGWANDGLNPRVFGDVNGDGFLDIIGFGNNSVSVALNQFGYQFNPNLIVASNYYCIANGFENNDKHPRIVKDINNDGRVDILGFGPYGLYKSLGKTDGTFDTPVFITTDFTAAQGVNSWQNNTIKPRYLEDMTGDGLPDIVGFNNNGVYVLKNTNGFSTLSNTILWVADFGTDQGWLTSNTNMRLIADMNNDGKKDIIGFKDAGAYIALTNSTGTLGLPKTLWTSNFANNTGWISNESYPRFISDLNNDGYNDIVGFGYNDVEVTINNKNNTFKPLEYWSTEFGNADGWGNYQSHTKLVGDINGDNFPDIMVIGADNSLIGLSNGNSFNFHQLINIENVNNYVHNTIPLSANPYSFPYLTPVSQNYAPKHFVNLSPYDSNVELIFFEKDGTYLLNCYDDGGFRMSENKNEQPKINYKTSIFPNPTNGKINIHTVNIENEVLTYNIFDLVGKKNNFIKTKETDFIMELSGSNGIYFLTIENETGILLQTQKIIKNN
jgi:hypothetical protein